MTLQRARAHIGVGNSLELVGAGLVCYGIDRLAGLAVALIVAGVLVVALAELVYSEVVLRVPLPRRPRPVARLRAAVARRRSPWLAGLSGR